MVEYINRTRSAHIITIEDPIEYVYEGKKALIHQRETGSDVVSFAAALRSALREDPDIILVGEMRDYETISAALTAAETRPSCPFDAAYDRCGSNHRPYH